MSEWIESHTALREHPKLKRLARLLGINRREAAGLLHWLWWWAMDYAPDGNLSAYTEADIADGLDWEGDAKKLIAALREAGFIDKKEFKLHDWEDYGGRLYRRREHNAELMRKTRAKDKDTKCATREQHVEDTSTTREETWRATGQDSTGQTVQDRTDRTDIKEAAATSRAREAEADPPVDSGGGDSTVEPEKAEEPSTDDPLLWDLWTIPGWKRDDVADPKLLLSLAKAYPQASLSQAIGEVATQALAGTLKTAPAAALPAFARLLQQKAPPPYVPPPRQHRERGPEATPEDLQAQAATLRACMEEAGIRPLRVAGGAP